VEDVKMAFDFIEDVELRTKVESEVGNMTAAMKDELGKSLQAEIDKATAALKSNNQKLLDEKKKIQDRFKDITDPDEALKAMKLINENEEMQMFRDGKFEDVIQRRLSSVTTQHEEAVKELTTKFETTEMTATKYRSLFQDLVIDNQLRSAAAKAGILPAAMEDVLNKGRNIFAVAEDERSVESRDHNGKLRKTEDDKVLTPENWIEGLKRQSPHYWPPSQAAGFTPGGGTSADDLEVQIQAAAKSGNSKLFRELREKQRKMKGK
jgi:hypothetical protein